MAQLPTEQDIGDLPDRLPRRMGVGSWQPNDIARGAEAFARGADQLGSDVASFAGQEARQQNQVADANANSSWAVDRINTHNNMSQQTDPVAAGTYADIHQANFNKAASMIPDLNARTQWQLQHAPELAQSQVAVNDYTTGLVKTQALADFDQNATTQINAAVSADDDGLRAGALNAIKQSGQTLVSRGILTPEQWQTKAREVSGNYASARVEAEIARANATGDTSRLQDLGKLFQFNPGEWGVAPSAGGVAPTVMQKAIWGQESGNNNNVAKSVDGAIGPGQVEPATFAQYAKPGEHIDNPADNRAVSARILDDYSQRYGGDPARVAVAYFSGPGNVAPAGSPTPYIRDAKDGNGKSVSSYVGDVVGRVQRLQQVQGGAPAAPGAPAIAPHAIGDSLAVGVGQVTGKANALTAATPQQVLAMIRGQDIVNKNGTAKGLTDADLKGTPIVLSSGASNDPGNASVVGDQLAALKGRGVDLSTVTVLGVGPRSDFQQLGVNNKLATIAQKYGAKFQPLDAGMIGPDNVHPVPQGYKALVSQIGGGAGTAAKPLYVAGPPPEGLVTPGNIDLAARPTVKNADGSISTVRSIGVEFGGKEVLIPTVAADGSRILSNEEAIAQYKKTGQHLGIFDTPDHADAYAVALHNQQAAAYVPQKSPFIGVPPPGATGANPHLVPPQSVWPADARGVEHNPDGSLSYVMDEGAKVPVPGSSATGSSGAPSPSGTGTLLDALPPQKRAELGVRIQNEIATINRRNGAQDDQYTKAAVADMSSRVGRMVAGEPLGPNEAAAIQPYSKSPIPQVRQTYATMMRIRDNLASYQGLSPAAVQADVATKEAAYDKAKEQYPNSTVVQQMGDILDASQKYAKTFSSEAVKTPLERAAKSGFLPGGVTAVNPQDPNVEASLLRRVSDAHRAADALGVPIRYLQQGERPMFKEIARQGGEPMVDLATHIVKAAGPDAPAIFKEIGVDAPMFQKIGELAANGGDPEAVRDIASVINAKNDKSASRDLPTFNDKVLKTVGEDPLEGAVGRFGPDFEGRTRAAANMLMTAKAQRDGWDPIAQPGNVDNTLVDRAYNLAVGATYAPDGTQYGGIVDRSPKAFMHPTTWGSQSNRTIVPNTIKANDFPSVINSIQDVDLRSLPNQPMGKNGAPISAAQITNGQLEAMPDKDGIFRGKYAVFTDGVRDDNHLVRGANGKPWALDLAQPQIDTALRSRNPNSFLAATPPAQAPGVAPPPARYRSTPGMVAVGSGEGLSGAAETE